MREPPLGRTKVVAGRERPLQVVNDSNRTPAFDAGSRSYLILDGRYLLIREGQTESSSLSR